MSATTPATNPETRPQTPAAAPREVPAWISRYFWASSAINFVVAGPGVISPRRSAELIGGLAQINATEPNEVLKTARATFEQHHWTVQGNIYQAAGDIIIPMRLPPPLNRKSHSWRSGRRGSRWPLPSSRW